MMNSREVYRRLDEMLPENHQQYFPSIKEMKSFMADVVGKAKADRPSGEPFEPYLFKRFQEAVDKLVAEASVA